MNLQESNRPTGEYGPMVCSQCTVSYYTYVMAGAEMRQPSTHTHRSAILCNSKIRGRVQQFKRSGSNCTIKVGLYISRNLDIVKNEEMDNDTRFAQRVHIVNNKAQRFHILENYLKHTTAIRHSEMRQRVKAPLVALVLQRWTRV